MSKNRPSKYDGYPADLAGGLELKNGEVIGRDPRQMTEAELNDLGHFQQPLLKIIRAKCLDCCHSDSEARKCTSIKTCALWPYRLRKNPFSKRTLSDASREAFERHRTKKTKKDVEPA